MVGLAAAVCGLVAISAEGQTASAAPRSTSVENSENAQLRPTGAKRVHRRKRGRLVRSPRSRRAPAVAFCSDPNVSGCARPVGRTLQAYASAPPPVARRAVGTTDRRCLVPAARALLSQLEVRFGPVRVVSTCRRGATIAGTRRPSMHRYGKAIDFIAPAGRKAEVISWLREHSPGVTMTYRGMQHIHTDVGSYRGVFLGGRGRRSERRQSRAKSSETTWGSGAANF